MRILIVEDETKIANALRDGFEAVQYEVQVSATGEEGFFLANREIFDLVILDIMLPRCSGMDVLAMLKKRDRRLPILVLTAMDTVEDRVRGLDLGADDYLVKPFAFPEVLARVRALVRRGTEDFGSKFCFADLELDPVARKVERAGKPLSLTPKEYEITAYLLRNQGRAVSREMLARDVWRVTARATPIDNAIDVTIARLRRKLDDPFVEKILHTVRGMGFILGRVHH